MNNGIKTIEINKVFIWRGQMMSLDSWHFRRRLLKLNLGEFQDTNST